MMIVFLLFFFHYSYSLAHFRLKIKVLLVFFRIVRYTFFMPEQYSPDRPEPKELRTSNDDFWDDLGRKIDEPYTKEELAAQHAAREEQRQILNDQSAIAEKIETGAEQLPDREGELPEEERKLIGEIRTLYAYITQLALQHHQDRHLADLGRQATEAMHEFEEYRKLFREDVSTTRAYTEAIAITHQQLEDIERRMMSNP